MTTGQGTSPWHVMLVHTRSQADRPAVPRNPGRKPGRRNPGPLGSAEERSEAQGKASMSEHRDVRVAQRPARREHRREPRVHDAHGARKWGAFFLGYFFLGKQKEVTRPSGRNALALEAKSEKRKAQSAKRKAKSAERRAKSEEQKIAGKARSHKVRVAARCNATLRRAARIDRVRQNSNLPPRFRVPRSKSSFPKVWR